MVPRKQGSGAAWPAIAIGMFVAFGGILFGYDTGTISGILAMPYWLKEFAKHQDANGNPELSSGDKSLIVSILSVGTFFGALMSAPTADMIGRRWGLIFSCGVFTVGVVLQTAATEQVLFIIGRLIAGWGVGLLSAQVPMYQSETAPKWIRGTIVGSYQLAITIGLLIAAVANYGTENRDDSGSYRIPLAIQFAWAIILVVGMLILPETPRYLIKRNKFSEAQKALSKLRHLPMDHPEIIAELNEVQANYEYELSIGTSSYKEFLTNKNGYLLKRLLTGCGLQALQQLSGVNFIFYYGTTFFKSAGIGKPFIITMITNCVNVVSTLPGLWMVESWGRRNLLLFGAAGMAVCQFIVATVGVTADSLAAQKCLIAFVCFYIFFFACSWGPVAWVVTGEIFPLKSRAKGLSITTSVNWLLNFIIGFVTPYMVDSGPGNANLGSKVFFIWGSFCAICFIFVYFFIYETKGLTLEEVDELYAKVRKAWRSKDFVPTVSFTDVNEERKSISGDAGRRLSLAEIEQSAQRRKSSIGGEGHATYREKV